MMALRHEGSYSGVERFLVCMYACVFVSSDYNDSACEM